jgi:hypothetical protein
MRLHSSTRRRMALTATLVIAVCAVAVVSLGAASPALAITADDCTTARAFGYTQTDVEIAADVALAADVILEAVPQDSLDAAPRAAAVAAWAIPQGALRGILHSFDIAQACDDNDHQQLVKDNLDVKVSSRASAAALADSAALDLRLKIESDLSEGPASTPIALFELPASSGGYIELARSIVADLIAKMQAANQPVANAPMFLARGDGFLAAHDYKHAYQLFTKAYRDAAKLK